ncbi:hypothetical protein IWW48_005326 [Coemansia sp. RSA 1200]|nr:hypothetical protein IWW48_005326 [Coemansia sp. RSA 1200]
MAMMEQRTADSVGIMERAQRKQADGEDSIPDPPPSTLLPQIPAGSGYRVYPEGDERALPDFILQSQTMEQVEAATSDWEAAAAALGESGDFWRAVVDDAAGLKRRAPLHLAAKIRAGIPGRLRGTVWQTLTQARSTYLQTLYSQLIQEHSPHERVIRRDLTRTFPRVPAFRAEGGEGQQRLFRILKAYSLYDAEVGYCQGLGFIIGPLIMNMGECAAFCVLVRLMETHELRGMFTEDMAGLHLRLHQFQALATEIAPALMAHLDALGVVPAMYVPSWFLSLFAYTMPLSFVLRAIDVAVAEGAPESIIRIGIALLQRNADTLLRQDDFESAMRVLNGGGLYDDDANPRDRPGYLLQEAARLSAVVTTERLASLEREYRRASSGAPDALPQQPVAAGTNNNAITRFLGWPWAKDTPGANVGSGAGAGAGAAAPLLSPAKTPSLDSLPGAADGASDSDSTSGSDDTAVAAAYARARNGGRISPRVLEMPGIPGQRRTSLEPNLNLQLDLQRLTTEAGADHAYSPSPSSAAVGAGMSGDCTTPLTAVSRDSSTNSHPVSHNAWRNEVLEPMMLQLHDARVTSDTHRDAMVSLQAELELLRSELVTVKTAHAEVAAENERLRMEARKLDQERQRADESASDAQAKTARAEDALLRTRLELAEADEERALLVRQLGNLRKFISDTTPASALHQLDDATSSSLMQKQSNSSRFSISSFASNWSAIRGAITSPRQSMQQDLAPPPSSASAAAVPSPSSSSSSSSNGSGNNGSGSTHRHSVIPMAMLHRSKTSPPAELLTMHHQHQHQHQCQPNPRRSGFSADGSSASSSSSPSAAGS